MSKFKINTNKEPLTPEEISKKMDFDKFYSGYSAGAGNTSWLSKTAKVWLGGAATTVVIVTATFVVYKSTNNKEISAPQAFIDPPSPELNASPDNFIIDNSKDTTIVYKTGTIIHVPANAFKHQDGKDAGKKVKICYREFRDPVDFIFSGIP